MFGGSLGEVFAEKVTKVMDLAVRTGCPLIGINDSEAHASRRGWCRWPDTLRSSTATWRRRGDPAALGVVGPCTGGAVYSPAITDFIFMVRGIGYMFITGPDVIKVTTGEQVGSRSWAARTSTTCAAASPISTP